MIEIQKITKNLGRVITKNSPTILTGLSVAGLVTTAVMAVRATPKAMQILENELKARPDETFEEVVHFFSKKEIIQFTWKCYLPAAIMGSLTIACIICANSIHLRRNAALASVYTLSEAALKEYQSKVVETIGNNKARKIKDEIAGDRIKKNPVNDKEIIFTGNGETLCYDTFSGRYFKSDIEQIRRAINKLGRLMLTDMTITLNDVYYELGLSSTKTGELLGWHVDDGLLEPDFSSQLTEGGVPCLVLDFSIEPRHTYSDY